MAGGKGMIVAISRRDAMLKVPAYILLWLVVLSAVISAVHYFLKFWGQLDDRIKQRRKLRMMESHKKSEDAVPL